MSRKDAEQPLVVKRKKVISGGHHGGAWKVAYADFVTAMMAFFLLMWLLSSTSDEQRQGIADYFSPTIPIHSVRGGGDGPFGGATMFADDTLAQIEPGARPGDPFVPEHSGFNDQKFGEVESDLAALSGDAVAADPLLQHIRTRLTDEGLIIEVFDVAGSPLFQGDSAAPTPALEEILGMIGRVLARTTNPIAIAGHVGQGGADPFSLSADRALAAGRLVVAAGVAEPRLSRVTGRADRSPATDDPADLRNQRVEITLLRRFDP